MLKPIPVQQEFRVHRRVRQPTRVYGSRTNVNIWRRDIELGRLSAPLYNQLATVNTDSALKASQLADRARNTVCRGLQPRAVKKAAYFLTRRRKDNSAWETGLKAQLFLMEPLQTRVGRLGRAYAFDRFRVLGDNEFTSNFLAVGIGNTNANLSRAAK